MDPLTAFAAAQAALAGVRKCVDFYKEAKKVSSDVGSIGMEIGGFLSKFFDAQEVVVKASNEAAANPAKKKSMNTQAFDNVMRVRHLQDAEEEIKHLLIYQTPMAGLYEDFLKERNRLRAEAARIEREEKKPLTLPQKSGVISLERFSSRLQLPLQSSLSSALWAEFSTGSTRTARCVSKNAPRIANKMCMSWLKTQRSMAAGCSRSAMATSRVNATICMGETANG